MAQWFRLYETILDDPKVQRLKPELFKAWVNLLALTCRGDGVLPREDDIAFALRVGEKQVAEWMAALAACGLLDEVDNNYVPHNWSARQWKSDSSAERVQRHRAKRAAAGLLAQWQPSGELRHSIYERDGFACVYCTSQDDLTIDHKTPEFRGGSNDPDNLQTTCRACNASKRDLTHEEFVARNADVTLQKRPQRTENRDREQRQREEGAPAQNVVVLAPGIPEAVEIYNTHAEQSGWAKVQRLTDARRNALKARLSECGGVDGWQAAMAKAGASKFLTGQLPRGSGHANWRPDFDWFVKAGNFTKLMEGSYDDKPGGNTSDRDGIAADFAYAAHQLRDKQYTGL